MKKKKKNVVVKREVQQKQKNPNRWVFAIVAGVLVLGTVLMGFGTFLSR